MSSVRAIAKKLNVSIATVSRALNNHPEINSETSARILKTANEIGYFNSVGRRITTQLGFVATSDNDFYEYDALLLSGIRRGISQHKFDVTILSVERDKNENESYTQFFLRKGVRGVIVRTLARSRHMCPGRCFHEKTRPQSREDLPSRLAAGSNRISRSRTRT